MILRMAPPATVAKITGLRVPQAPKQRRTAKLRWCRQKLLQWYLENGRKFAWRSPNASSYERVVTEILLQRTQAETVDRFFGPFFRRYRSWEDINCVDLTILGKSLKRIGLWRRRATALKSLAAEMVPLKGQFPSERRELEMLPAVGQYVANAVLLFVHGQPRPLLDASMARLLERVFEPRKLVDIRYDPGLQALAHDFFRSSRSVELNWAALDVAAIYCHRIDPVCAECPLRSRCNHAGALRAEA